VSCWNEKGFNQRGTTFFLEDHYMDKKSGQEMYFFALES
jgi:hypothetical protein